MQFLMAESWQYGNIVTEQHRVLEKRFFIQKTKKGKTSFQAVLLNYFQKITFLTEA